MSIAIFPVLAVVALILLGCLVGLILLIANPKTRVAGILLLVLGPMVLAIVGGGLFLVTARFETQQRADVKRMEMDRIVAQQLAENHMTRLQGRERQIEAEKMRRSHVQQGQLLVEQTTHLEQAKQAEAAAARMAKQLNRLTGLAPEKGAAAAAELAQAVDLAKTRAAQAQASIEQSGGIAGSLARAMIKGFTNVDSQDAQAILRVANQESTSPEPTKTAATKVEAEPAKPTATQPQPDAESRPAWVGKAAGPAGDGYRMEVVVGPYSTREECDEKAPEHLQAAFNRFVQICVGPEASGRLEFPRSLRQKVIKEQWAETIQASFGPMIQLHVLLEFGPEVRDRLEQAWQEAIIAGRIWSTGVAVTSLLALLGVLFAGLKIDEAGGGKRRGWLAAAGVLAAGAILATGYSAISLYSTTIARYQALPATSTYPVTHDADAYRTTDADGAQIPKLEPDSPPRGSLDKASWMIVLPLGLLLLAFIVTLLVNKRTRVFGFVVLVAVALGALVLVS